MPLLRTTDPVAEPVTLEEVRGHLRVDDHDGGDENTWLTSTIKAVRAAEEDRLRIQFIKAPFEYSVAAFTQPLHLPRPVVDPDSIELKYVDEAGEEQTLDADLYRVVQSGRFTSIRFIDSLPSLSSKEPYPVRVTFEAGFESGSVPDELKQYLMQLVGFHYIYREGARPTGQFDMRASLEYLVHGYQRRYFK